MTKWTDYFNRPDIYMSTRMKQVVTVICGCLFQLLWVFFNAGSAVLFFFGFTALYSRFGPTELLVRSRVPIKRDYFVIFFFGQSAIEIAAVVRFFVLGGAPSVLLQIFSFGGLYAGGIFAVFLLVVALQFLMKRRKRRNIDPQPPTSNQG